MTNNKAAAQVLTHPSGQTDPNLVTTQLDTPRRKCQPPAHGTLRGSLWLKRVIRAKHMLRTPPGWAVDVLDLDRAERCGATRLVLFEQERQIYYSATLATIRTYGRPIDRGFGKQLALCLGYWETKSKKPDPSQPAQLSLFGANR